MCTQVIIGDIECETQAHLAAALGCEVGALPLSTHEDGSAIYVTGSLDPGCCLCPIDIEVAAIMSGYRATQNDRGDFTLVR